MVKLPGLPRFGGYLQEGPTISLKAVSGEFVGALLFQLLAASSQDILAVAFSFATIQYALKYVSGGHLNPAVSLAAAGSGHIRWHTGLLYSTSQVLGSLLGAVVQVLLLPGSIIGKESAGCMEPSSSINYYQLLGWEFLLSFLFILVQYASLFVPPGHGNAAPLASGIALYAILDSVGSLTGYSPVNPARTIASTVVFNCYWRAAGIYLTAQILACLASSLAAITIWGRGMYFPGLSEEAASRVGASYEESLLPGPSSEVQPAGQLAAIRASETFAPEGRIPTGGAAATAALAPPRDYE